MANKLPKAFREKIRAHLGKSKLHDKVKTPPQVKKTLEAETKTRNFYEK